MHRIGRIEVILHGGEPLLAGPAVLTDIAQHWPEICRSAPNSSCCSRRTKYCWNETVLRVLRTHGIRVGISVDAKPDDHDRHRRTRTTPVATRKPTRHYDFSAPSRTGTCSRTPLRSRPGHRSGAYLLKTLLSFAPAPAQLPPSRTVTGLYHRPMRSPTPTTPRTATGWRRLRPLVRAPSQEPDPLFAEIINLSGPK